MTTPFMSSRRAGKHNRDLTGNVEAPCQGATAIINQPTGRSTPVKKSPAQTTKPASITEKTTRTTLSIGLSDTSAPAPVLGMWCECTGTVGWTIQPTPLTYFSTLMTRTGVNSTSEEGGNLNGNPLNNDPQHSLPFLPHSYS